MKLIWGRGIEGLNGAGALNESILCKMHLAKPGQCPDKTLENEDIFSYRVRVPFKATLSCERERPNAPCSPMSGLVLKFSDKVDRSLAEQIRLRNRRGIQKPWDYSAERKAALRKLGQKVLDAKVDSGNQDNVDRVVFKGPFPPNTDFTITLPKNFRDLSGRLLSNARNFPLKTRVGGLPPLVKFAADFGILEQKEGGVLPVTLRNVESTLTMRVLRETDEMAMINTWLALNKFENRIIKLPASGNSKKTDGRLKGNKRATLKLPPEIHYPREYSYLASRNDSSIYALPKPGGSKAFEVVGIPLPKPGFYVVEIESKILGASLFKDAKPMFVRSKALVTNLAVHFKSGRDNSLVWVSSLSDGKPVAAAKIQIFDCKGKSLRGGQTDERGIAMVKNLPVNRSCFVTARLGDDFSFVRSDWTKGIEAWRFNMNSWNTIDSPKIHTLLDRTLLRAGETVSMKHIARIPQVDGFSYPKPSKLPKSMTIQLPDGEQAVSLPLTWDSRGVATSEWHIPKTAKLGRYTVQMKGSWQQSAAFRVSEFRLPKYKGAVTANKPRFAHISKVPLRLSLAYLNGGSANGEPVKVSALLSRAVINFPLYREFNFRVEDKGDEPYHRLIADKQELKLDSQGGARLELPIPAVNMPTRLRTEMTFTDPGGEVQTISGTTEIWPANIIIGTRIIDWATLHGTRKIQVVALDMRGQPKAGVPIRITAKREWDYVHRKRILGGFYSYESVPHSEKLGTICQGKTDKLGLFECKKTIRDGGKISLHVEGSDAQKNLSQADTSYWSSNDGDFWFEQEDQDRMEVVPEKRHYEVGETARFQVRTPFREATALITVEREGILESFVRPLLRRNALVTISVGENWGPNVYISVLVVRGRVAVPQATAMIDLARPAFKLGLTRIEVGKKGAQLQLKLKADKAKYTPRETAKVKIQVRLPNGKLAAKGSEVLVVAVDRALLELSPNRSWNLLDAMMQERLYLIETATAQMQVVGKRHFGKKALPAGGGGGKLSSRELFDTLLYWNPRVKLDEHGAATVKIPLNDSLTAFKVVAVADIGKGFFGTGETEFVSTQDLQITSALPPIVREGDRYRAMLSLRNTTQHSMQLEVQASAGKQTLTPQSVKLAAGEAKEIFWQAKVPSKLNALPWIISAIDSRSNKILDRIKLTQKIQPRVPVTTQQAMFMRVEKPYSISTALPDGAIAGKGGIEVRLSARLADQTDGIQRFFKNYPFTCLEQKVSLAVGLQDTKRWDEIVSNLPGYLDSQGLLQYFPGSGRGNEGLTAYVLVMAHENGIKLPAVAEKKMRKALLDFAEGRLKPDNWRWGKRQYLDERHLNALEALSHTGDVTGRMLTAYKFAPLKMPTTTLIDWYSLTRRVADAPNRRKRLK